MKILKRFMMALVVLLMLLLSSVALLIYTQSGTKLLFNLVQHWVPQLEIQHVSGSLDHLTLTGLQYRQPGITASIGELQLNSQLSSLLHGELNITQLSLAKVAVTVESSLLPNTPSNQPSNSAQIALPIKLAVHQLQVSDLNVVVNNNRIQIEQFDTQLAWAGSKLILNQTMLNNTQLHLATSPAAQQAASATPQVSPSKVTLQQQITQRLQQVEQQLKQPVQLPDIVLPINLQIKQFQAINTQILGTTPLTLNKLSFSLSAQQSTINLTQFLVDSSLGDLSLTTKAQLTAGWTIQLNGQGELRNPSKQALNIAVQGNFYHGLQAKFTSTGHFNTQLLVKLALHQPDSPLLLQFDSEGLQWPLTGQPQFSIQQSHLLIQGALAHYTIKAHLAMQLAQLPALKLQLNGQGNATQFDLQDLNIQFKNSGNIGLAAQLNWGQSLSLTSQVKLQQLNLAQLAPSLKSQLNGGGQLNLDLSGNTWQIALHQLAITGQFNGQALKLSGNLQGSSDNEWQFNSLDLELGSNKVTLQGRYQHNADLTLVIKAPDLSHIVSHLQGSVFGNIKLQGSWQYPQIFSHLKVSNFVWQNLSIAQLELQSNITGTQALQGKLALTMQQLEYGDQLNLQSMSLTASGTEAQHQIQLSLNGEPVGAKFNLEGDFNRQTMRWQIGLKQAVLQLKSGDWQLQHPTQLSYNFNNQQLTINQQCWKSQHGQICLPKTATISADQGHLALQLTQLQLSVFNPELALQNIALSGDVSAKAQLAWSKQHQKLLPNIILDIKSGAVQMTDLVTTQVIPLIKETSIKLSLDPAQATIQIGVALPKSGSINANIKIADPLVSKTLSGNLAIQALDLSQLKPLLQHSDQFSGEINADLKLAGSLTTPKLLGTFKAQQLVLQDKKLPLQLNKGNLQLNFLGQQATLAAQLEFAKGQLKLTGSSNWSKRNKPEAQIKAQGQNIQVEIPLYGDITLSPDISLQATPQQLQIAGKLDIPEANLQIKSLPSSVVNVSDDQVLVDSNLQPILVKKQALPLNGQLEIHIGPKVLFSGFGLTTGLNGTTMLLLNKSNVALHGNVFLSNGKYQAYGQNLLIRKGQLTFAGPISATSLNIEAIRNPDAIRDNVTAGIKVTGSIQHPKVALFSQPALPQQQILSYVLRGQSLDGGDNNSSLATTLLLSLGSSTGTNILKKLTSPLGIKDLSIDSKGSGQQSQVVVSGYILPKLKVEYGVGLFDSLATLSVRYQLFSQLYLEAKSGLNQTLELLYQFSFN